MKRIFVMILTIIFVAACSSPSKEVSTSSNDTNDETIGTEASETEKESGIEVDKGLLHVVLTLPSSLFDEEELAEMEAHMQKEANADVTQNEDGSITVKMSKKDHKKMLTEMKEDFSDSINEITEDNELASIKNITYNKDFTEMKMVVDKEAFENSFDGFATMSLGIGSLFFQAFNGKDLEKEKVKILLEDEATEEVYQEIIYPDVLDEMGEE